MKDLNIVMVVACVFSAFTFLAVGVMQDRAAQQAAQTECARFNPETGDFEWLDKQGDTK